MNTTDIYIVKPSTDAQAIALKAFINALKIKFEVTDKPYSFEFLEKIKQSEIEIEQGKTKKVKREDLKYFLGL